MAVVQAGSCSSNLTPSLEASICRRCGHKRKKKGGEAKWDMVGGAAGRGGYVSIVLVCRKKSKKGGGEGRGAWGGWAAGRGDGKGGDSGTMCTPQLFCFFNA